jgi:hypothetical protein
MYNMRVYPTKTIHALYKKESYNSAMDIYLNFYYYVILLHNNYYTAAAILRMEAHSLVVASARLRVLHSRIPPIATVAHRTPRLTESGSRRLPGSPSRGVDV